MTTIVKADGTVEEFDQGKLTASLRRAGADASVARDIAGDVAQNLKDTTPTQEIYSKAFHLLHDHRREAAARYSLKRAIMDFGPSGFPFETYLAELFRAEGYHASVDSHVPGKCVEHEVDVVLSRGDEVIYVEAKFHNNVGFKTDLQVALYVQARLADIVAGAQEEGSPEHMRGILATNTKFTSLAIQYANCKKLGLLGWEYPAEGNLHDKVEKLGLYPITALTTLSHGEKTHLLAERVVLCRDLTRHEDALAHAGVSGNRMNEVLLESAALCGKK